MAHVGIGKLSGSISITASPTIIMIGESTTISGSITPASVGENVTIWHRQIGKPWGILATVTTDGTGQYSYICPDLDMGTYELKATWIGDTYAAESSIITVDVKAPPAASFTYLPHTPTIGETITFDASASFDLDGTIETYAWDFDDGTTGTGVTTTHAYTTADTYDVTLTVTDNDTLTDTAASDVTVSPPALQPPVASFIYSPTAPQVDETVTIDASASSDSDGTIVSYEWDFGDETDGTSEIATHIYADNGTYVVTLKVTDNDGLSDTTSKDITVLNRPPNATFTESAETVYTGEVISFNASDSYDPDGTIASYFWDFGDETNATGMIVEHSYADDGNYTVTLTVTDDDGATHNATATKTVLNRSPVASFTESAEIVYLNETIYFNATGSYDPDGNITNYFWDFGDETNATGVTTEHSYPLEGNYTVTLTVIDDDDAPNSTSASKTILNRPPVAVFTESAEQVYTNETVYFNASESYDSDGSIVSYLWDFGDETNATGVVVEHAYADDGNYTVTLTVMDDDNATDTTTAIKTVLNRPPVAIFTESTETAYIGEAIVFNASDSYDPDGTIASYFWDFGDETNTTGVIANHAYDINGTFTVTLTVTDDDGTSNSSSSTKTILKNEPPIPLFTESAETVYTGEVISFNASDSYDPDGNITNYFWDFGDGTNTTGVTVDHVYVDDGVYTITLVVTDDDGKTASKSAVKTVSNRPPIALFTENPTIAFTDEIIHFDASSSNDPDGSVISYFWDFGDGTDATGVTVNHAYEDDGVYTVTLTVTDDDGETASKSAVETVSNRPPIALFTDDATNADVDELIRFDASGSYDPDGIILNYFWDFGDGTNATMCVILGHAYTEDGDYTVTLTVTDDDGTSSSTSATMTVKGSLGWPLYLIAGTALGIAGLTGAVIYIIFRRKRKTASETTAPENKPFITLYVPRSLFAGYGKLTDTADNPVDPGRT